MWNLCALPKGALTGVSGLGLVLALSGCQTVHYYSQAVRGQGQVLARQQSCEELLNDPRTSPELKAKLELARRLREFAGRGLSLPANVRYGHRLCSVLVVVLRRAAVTVLPP